ncbi:MAG: HypC/HybG/HupF family hydrogenase formation chaperone [Rhodospirillales bacterium]|jgi:hydrogenase expression/formation protein HypC|nr:HypC/HybG/HupF family hydrogenase formation chaperone [Rhodospirillales bacterium]
MCLAIPMRIVAIDGMIARCDVRGVTRDVNLFMLQDEAVAIGDHVLVHVGYAIQRLSEDDARETWALFDEAMALEERALAAG